MRELLSWSFFLAKQAKKAPIKLLQETIQEPHVQVQKKHCINYGAGVVVEGVAVVVVVLVVVVAVVVITASDNSIEGRTESKRSSTD